MAQKQPKEPKVETVALEPVVGPMMFPSVKYTAKRGRPKARDVDPNALHELAKICCTQAEAAAVCGVSLATLKRQFDERPALRQAWDDGLQIAKASLRHAQFKSATTGNVTAQIWLGKQILGQKDKVQLSGDEDTGPIQISDARDEFLKRIAGIAIRFKD